MGAAAGVRRRDPLLLRDCAELFHPCELLRDYQVQRRARPPRGRTDARHRRWRNRSVGRLDDGTRCGHVWSGVSRVASGTAAGGRGCAVGRLRWRRAECAAHCKTEASRVDRDAWDLLAVSRRRRGDDARRGQLHRVPLRVPVSGPGLPGRPDSGAAAAVRAHRFRLRGAAAPLGSWSRLVRDRIHGAGSALRRDSCGQARWSRLRVVGIDCERCGDHLRGASGAGAVGRGHRLRARCDHRRCAGLHLAAWPSELTGVLTGVLLLATIAADRHIRRRAVARAAAEELQVKNSQVAVLCGAILAGSLIVAGTNVWLLRTVGAGSRTSDGHPPPAALHRTVIAVMPKAKGDPYFVSCRAGAEEAARELDVDLVWDGPTSLDAAKQNELVENWITRKVDAVAVAVENRAGISTVLRKARERGIRVLTWDADAEPDARDYFVNQATAEGIANALTDEAARLLGGKGDVAIITGALSAANQNEWIAFIRKRLEDKHTGLRLATIRPSDDDRDKAFAETQTLLKVYPSVKLMMAISAPAVPGSAEAVRQAGRKDVSVIGLSLPNINKPYVHSGIVQTVVLWNTRDLGYLAVYASALVTQNKLAPGARALQAGRLGQIEVRDSEIILGAPMLFNRSNIDRFDF